MDRPRSVVGLTFGLAVALAAAAPAMADGHHGRDRYVLVPATRAYVPAETTRVYERRYVTTPAAEDESADSSDRGVGGSSEFEFGEDGRLKYLGADTDREAKPKPTTRESATREAPVERVRVREVPVERVVVREAPVERVVVREVPAQRVLVREVPVERVIVREVPAEPVYLLREKKHHWLFGR